MTNAMDSKYRLSKAVLEMKFMKKSKERFEREKEVEDSRALFSDVITEDMKHGKSKYIIESSYVPCEDLIVGRLSFHGMNPEIEEIMKEEETAAQKEIDVKNEVDVSDLEMAQHFGTVVQSIHKKFMTKREKRKVDDEEPVPPKKPKFLKPCD
ncbi:M-phase phosphoprotein 6 [Schistocerca gregaria]|uniref:M-phase phosphoprotein 6 n=1 Tax=Schistocerca gregaria TaxID=7010 RepID=UPI00211E2A9A|nr:M-phase phosphoprotein 6 [Schistocerca gregaria]